MMVVDRTSTNGLVDEEVLEALQGIGVSLERIATMLATMLGTTGIIYVRDADRV